MKNETDRLSWAILAVGFLLIGFGAYVLLEVFIDWAAWYLYIRPAAELELSDILPLPPYLR